MCMSLSYHVFCISLLAYCPARSFFHVHALLRSISDYAVEISHYHYIYFASSFLIQNVFYFVVDLFHFAFSVTRRWHVHLYY
uniref:Putative product n=1 Tax=Xenopsylla cheopis TaxID=163159 RepID=A0A6M2E283_XENCH